MRKWLKLNIEDVFKTTVLTAFILAGVYAVVFGCIILSEKVFSSACGNDILDEIYSPDNQYKVVVFRSDCGTTARIRTNASILRAEHEISSLTRGNIFFASDVVEIQVIWIDNRSIKITLSSMRQAPVEKRELSYLNEVFEISFEILSPE